MKSSLLTLFIFALFASVSAVNISLCIVQENLSNCEKLKRFTNVFLECIPARDRIECMHKVKDGIANIVNLGSNEAYAAGTDFSLSPLLEERVNEGDYMYEGVAVIRKNSSISSLSNLNKKKSCHTGYGRTAGWDIPIALLMAENKFPESKCGNDLSLASGLFSQSCVPGYWSPDPVLNEELKNSYKNLCTLCDQQCRSNGTEKYTSYEGALKCLVDKSADIAFTKHAAVADWVNKDPSFAEEYELLCANGSVVDLTQNCFWAARPNPLVVVHDKLSDEDKALLRTQIQVLLRGLPEPPNRPDYLKGTLLSNSNSKELRNVTSNVKDYLSRGNFTITLDKVLPKTCKETYTQLCVITDIEKRKCQDIKSAAFASRLRPHIVCVERKDEDECFQAIRDNKADIRIVDAYGLYKGKKYYNLKPVLKETYADGDSSQYAVALVRANSDIKKLEDLKGRKACFPSVFDAAGWTLPVTMLVKRNIIKADGCSLNKKVAEFFSKSCAPGAPNDLPSLCQLCKGESNGNSCSLDSPYSGYFGALECFAAEGADVAFVLHRSWEELILKFQESKWRDLFANITVQILCPDGGVKSFEDYKQCNWGKLPYKQVVTNMNKNGEELRNLQMMLTRASSMFRSNSTLFKLFSGYEERYDILFSNINGTLCLQSNDTKSILGKDLSSRFELTDCSNGSSRVNTNSLLAVIYSIIVFIFTKKIF